MSAFDPWDGLERLARARLRLAGIRSRRLDGPDGPIHAYDGPGRGERPPVVLLHGIGSSATAYGKLLLRLKREARRVLAPDLPGHGFSARPQTIPSATALAEQAVEIVDGLLDDVDGPVTVIGTSMGGALALRYALSRPQRVSALVLCSPAGAPIEGAELQTLQAQFDMGAPDAGHAFVDRLFAGRPPMRGLVARAVRDRLSRPIVQTLLGDLSPDDFLTPDDARRLRPPTLLLWGTAERVLPESCRRWYATHLPDHVRIERPEGWGHSAHLEQAGALVERVCAFVDRVAPSDGGSCPQRAGEAPSGSRL